MMKPKLKITKSRRLPQALALVALAAVAAGCGQTSYKEGDATAGGVNGNTAPTNGGVVTTTVGGVTVPPIGSPANLAPDLVYSPKMTGNGATYTSPSAAADSVLKVTVTAGDLQQFSSTSNWTIGFNCERVTVTVLGASQTVLVKRPGYVDPYYSYYGFDPCAGAQDSAVIDFSARLNQGSNNNFNVKLSNLFTDNCHVISDAYGNTIGSNPKSGGCPISSLYMTYPVSVNIAISRNQIQ